MAEQVDLEARMLKAGRFRAAAEEALDGGDFETCLSRAYYAVLHAAIVLLIHIGKPEAGNWGRQQIFNEFVRLTTRRRAWLRSLRMLEKRDFAGSLDSLYNLREKADYGLIYPSRREAREAVNFCGRIVTFVNELVFG